MFANHIDAYIAENGLLSTIELLLEAPGSLGMTETEAVMKKRIIAQILAVPREVAETVAKLTDSVEALRERPLNA